MLRITFESDPSGVEIGLPPDKVGSQWALNRTFLGVERRAGSACRSLCCPSKSDHIGVESPSIPDIDGVLGARNRILAMTTLVESVSQLPQCSAAMVGHLHVLPIALVSCYYGLD